MKETAAMPKMPRPTITATTIRMTLRALLLLGAVASEVGAGAGEEDTAADVRPNGWVAPHFVLNFAPPSRVAPQALQNAIKLTSRSLIFAPTPEYIASLPREARQRKPHASIRVE